MTILEGIENATSAEIVRNLLTLGNNNKPSGKTRRSWLRAAKLKLNEYPRLQGEVEGSDAS